MDNGALWPWEKVQGQMGGMSGKAFVTVFYLFTSLALLLIVFVQDPTLEIWTLTYTIC